MIVQAYPNYTDMSYACARLAADILRQKPTALFCFAAGSTSLGTFKALIDMQKRGETDFSQARFTALDEWLDLADESENCAAFMRRNLYGPLGIRDAQIKFFDIHNPNKQAMLDDMNAHLQANGPIDYMLLGIGMNGHVGFNEPGIPWTEHALIADLDNVTASVGQKYFSRQMSLTRGVTLGMRHILETKTVVLQASGAHKQEIVQKLLDCTPSPDLPASAVKTMATAYFMHDIDL